MKTPVAFVIFNRPKQTKQVFEAIKRAQPEKLYIIADGPRSDEERRLCIAARKATENVDWECEVTRDYADTNLGCGVRESSGLNRVFKEVEQAIILEDDCLPNPTFFPFCEELLARYKNDDRIMSISGNFFQQKNRHFKSEASYYASVLPHVWGWATWRRAWQKYDYNLKKWPELQKTGELKEIFKDPATYEYWGGVWDRYLNEKVNNYDSQWVFACVSNNAICLNPTVNLISNIGFGADATHTKEPDEFSNIPTNPMIFPLAHPKELVIDRQADVFTSRQNFGIDEKIRHRILRPIKNTFPKQYWSIRRLFK